MVKKTVFLAVQFALAASAALAAPAKSQVPEDLVYAVPDKRELVRVKPSGKIVYGAPKDEVVRSLLTQLQQTALEDQALRKQVETLQAFVAHLQKELERPSAVVVRSTATATVEKKVR